MGYIKSSQFNFIIISQITIVLKGLYNLYGIRQPLPLDPGFKKKLPLKRNFNKEKMEETSGRATVEGSLSQDGDMQSISCVQNRSTTKKITYTIMMTKIQIHIDCKT